VTGGEGGALLINKKDEYYRALLLGQPIRSNIEIPKKHALSKFTQSGMGLKMRIHPLAAAIADEQFNSLNSILAERRKIAALLIEGLSGLPGIKLPEFPKDSKPTWYAFIIQYRASELGGLPIDRFRDALVAEGCKEVDRPVYTTPLNLMPTFKDPRKVFDGWSGSTSYTKGDFPIAERLYKTALKLPVWHNESQRRTAELYVKAFKKVIGNYKELL
jgi:dTDP-4-amino-4,6-dideoxygalactose transaminase